MLSVSCGLILKGGVLTGAADVLEFHLYTLHLDALLRLAVMYRFQDLEELVGSWLVGVVFL